MTVFSNFHFVVSGFAAENGGSSGGIGALGVDLKALVLQALTFLLVFWLLKRFALGKIVQTLEERRKTIDQGVELGRRMAEEKARLDEEVEKVLHKARMEADKIITAGHLEAGVFLKEAADAAARKTDAMLADAHDRIEDDIARARTRLEQEVLHWVAEATEVVLHEKVDTDKDQELIKRALSEVKA